MKIVERPYVEASRRALLEAGMVPSPGQRILPSLEDVFIHAVARSA